MPIDRNKFSEKYRRKNIGKQTKEIITFPLQKITPHMW